MEKILKGPAPSKAEVLLKGRLLWELLNKNKEINIKIFGVWFLLLFILSIFILGTSEKTNKLDLSSTIGLCGIGLFFYCFSFYKRKKIFFKYVDSLSNKTAEFGHYSIRINNQSISYQDNKLQFSYPWEEIKTFTVYKNHLFILFGGIDLRHSIILNNEVIENEEFGETVNLISNNLQNNMSNDFFKKL